MAMRGGENILKAFFLEAALLMLTVVFYPICTNGKDSIFETDLQGSVGDILGRCSISQRNTLEGYLESFDGIGKKVIPYATNLSRRPTWDESSDSSKSILETWMRSKTEDLQRVFAVIEAAPIVPQTCSLEREPSPFVPGVEQESFSPITFWRLQSGKKYRRLVEAGGPSLTSYGSLSLYGDRIGYDIQYTKAETNFKNFHLAQERCHWIPTDMLVLTCKFKTDGHTYILQMAWNVPAIIFQDQQSLRQYLKTLGPGFYAFDIDSKKTAFFRRSVENLPTARPLVNW